MLEINNTVVVLRIKIADSLHSDMGPTIARKAPDCQTHTLSPCQPYLASVDFDSIKESDFLFIILVPSLWLLMLMRRKNSFKAAILM